MSLLDPTAYNAHLMPHHERVIADTFEHDLGSIGLFFDQGGTPVAAWYIEMINDAEIFMYSTASVQAYPWVPDNPRSPLSWVYNEDDLSPMPAWEDSGFSAYEVCPDGLIDLSAAEDGNTRNGKQIAAEMASATVGRFFMVRGPGTSDFSLVTRAPDGQWFGNACGPEFTFDREYPHADAVDLMDLGEDDYDSPLPYDNNTIYKEQRGQPNTWSMDRVPLIHASRKIGQIPALAKN